MRPTSDQSKIANGTYRPAVARPPLGIPKGIPKPPVELDPQALEIWNDVVPDLKKSGVLARVDRLVIAMYCELGAEFLSAPRDFPVGKIKELRLLSGELGCSISGRLKMKAPESAPDEEEECKTVPQGGNVVSISGLLSRTPRTFVRGASMPADTSDSPASDS